jgi:T5SS/PEP-CTERM-associated repeat protein
MYYPHFQARPLTIALAAILAGLPASSARAYELVWDGSGDSDSWFYSNNDFFHPNTNWFNNDPLLLPKPGDTLVFKGHTRLTPLNDGPDGLAINGITFAADANAFTLNGNFIFSIGNITNASRNLQIINMPIAIDADQIWDGGNIAGSFLQVNQFAGLRDHSLTLLRHARVSSGNNPLILGESGQAQLLVQGASKLETVSTVIGAGEGSTAEVTIQGWGSKWTNSEIMNIGTHGKATLNILDSGSVVSKSTSIDNGGKVTIDGLGSSWTNSDYLNVGYLGEGTLSVTNGGALNSGRSTIGDGTGHTSLVTIDGTGSKWTNQSLFIGSLRQGSLKIANGGMVGSGQSVIGSTKLSRGLASIEGPGSSWKVDTSSIIGEQGAGELNIVKGGRMESESTFIGNHGIGKVLISDSGSSMVSTGNLSVGYERGSRGELLVGRGGSVSNAYGYIGAKAGSFGDARIVGDGSNWHNVELRVGAKGNGSLLVSNGGTVIDGIGYIGAEAQSIGQVSVFGSGALWFNGRELFVGDQGNGSLVVDNGGTVKSGRGTIGNASSGVGTAKINGAESTWTVKDLLVVGNAGNGALNVENGGLVASASAVIGNAIGGLGTVTVNGDGSQWRNQGDLFIGRSGQGLLNIENHGLVSVGGQFGILRNGVVNLNGGTLEVVKQDDVRPGPGGQFNWRAGTLSITGADGVTLGRNEIFSPVTTLTSGKTLAVSRNLNVNSGNLLFLNGGSVKAGRLALNGGQIVFHNGSFLDMNDIGTLSGYGTLASTVSGGSAANTIRANNGNLVLGDANSTQGFEFGGKLEVGSNQVTLLDKDKANLGVSTILADGGKLTTVNGADLGSGEALSYTGNASILGDFTNNGEVSGTDGVLTFLNDVNGAGGFNGDIAFHGDYNPGNSPAAIDFHGGDISFNAASVLTMEIFGNTPGSQYDQLLNIDHFDFNGTLALVFGGNFTPNAGDVFSLFDFAGFSGSFSPNRISVAGIDRHLLDFSQLAANGSLRVAAVPLPTTAWLFLSGLLGILAKSRRNTLNRARQS